MQSGLTLAAIDSNWADIQANRRRIDELEADSREGTAMAMAISGIHLPSGAKRAMTLRYGHFRGQDAVALGAAFRYSNATKFDLGVAYGTKRDQVGYAAGVTFQW